MTDPYGDLTSVQALIDSVEKNRNLNRVYASEEETLEEWSTPVTWSGVALPHAQIERHRKMKVHSPYTHHAQSTTTIPSCDVTSKEHPSYGVKNERILSSPGNSRMRTVVVAGGMDYIPSRSSNTPPRHHFYQQQNDAMMTTSTPAKKLLNNTASSSSGLLLDASVVSSRKSLSGSQRSPAIKEANSKDSSRNLLLPASASSQPSKNVMKKKLLAMVNGESVNTQKYVEDAHEAINNTDEPYYRHDDYTLPALEFRSLESTILDMKTVTKRIIHSVHSLATGNETDSMAKVQLDRDFGANFFARDLRQMEELQKAVNARSSDYESQRHMVSRLDQSGREKDETILTLRRENDELKLKIEDLEAELSHKEDGGGGLVEGNQSFRIDGRGSGGGGGGGALQRFNSIRKKGVSVSALGGRHLSRAKLSVARLGGSGTAGDSHLKSVRRSTLFGISFASTLLHFSTLQNSLEASASLRGQSSGQQPLMRGSHDYPSFSQQKMLDRHKMFEPKEWSEQCPEGPDTTFLSISCAGLDSLFTSDSDAAARAMKTIFGAIQKVAAAHEGYVVICEYSHTLIAFPGPLQGAACALQLQVTLCEENWPSSLSELNDFMTVTNEAVSPAVRVWHGARLKMGLHHAGIAAEFERDIVTGKMHYFGDSVKMAMYLRKVSCGGMILVQEELKVYLEEYLIDLGDPILAFHCWHMLPAISGDGPSRLFILCNREHIDRIADFETQSIREMGKFLYRMVSQQDVLPNDVMMQKMQATMTAGESGVEQGDRLRQNSFIAPTNPAEGGEEGGFTAAANLATHVQQLGDYLKPIRSFPEVKELLLAASSATTSQQPQSASTTGGPRSGDQCLVYVQCTDIHQMLHDSDEAALMNYLRKYHTFVQQARPMNVDAYEVQTMKDKMLFAFGDPLEGLRFALSIHEKSVSIAWPDHGELHEHVRPRKFKKKIVKAGPSISVAVHWCRVKCIQDLFHSKTKLYTGDEIPFFASMAAISQESASIAQPCGALLLSELMYTFLLFHLEELGSPFVEPCGMLEVPPPTCMLSPKAVAEYTPRGVPQVLYQVVPRSLIGRYPLKLNYQLKSWIESGIIDVTVAKELRQELKEYLYGEDQAVKQLLRLPSLAVLSESDTMTSLSTQAIVTRCFFEREKCMKQLEQYYLFRRKKFLNSSHPSQQGEKDGKGDGVGEIGAGRSLMLQEKLENAETALMFEHDEHLPSICPIPVLLLTKFDILEYVQFIDAQCHEEQRKQQGQLLVMMKNANNAEGGKAMALNQSTLVEDNERKFFLGREARVAAEVQVIHKLLQFYFSQLRTYLTPLIDENAPALPDDDFIIGVVQCVRKLQAALNITLAESAGEKAGGGSGSPFKSNKVGEQWKEIMGELVTIEEGDRVDYDVVKLCRSMVAHCCKHFLFMRTVSKRVQRHLEKVNTERAMMKEANSKISRIVSQANTPATSTGQQQKGAPAKK